MRLANLLAFVALAASLVAAHPGEEHNHVSAADLALREMPEATARFLQARKCASAIAAFEAGRMNFIM